MTKRGQGRSAMQHTSQGLLKCFQSCRNQYDTLEPEQNGPRKEQTDDGC
jgi:hypothetical protein